MRNAKPGRTSCAWFAAQDAVEARGETVAALSIRTGWQIAGESLQGFDVAVAKQCVRHGRIVINDFAFGGVCQSKRCKTAAAAVESPVSVPMTICTSCRDTVCEFCSIECQFCNQRKCEYRCHDIYSCWECMA